MRDDTDGKPRCPECSATLNWLAQKMQGRFCSARCKDQYLATITRLAVERLHTTLPKRGEPESGKPASVVLTPSTGILKI